MATRAVRLHVAPMPRPTATAQSQRRLCSARYQMCRLRRLRRNPRKQLPPPPTMAPTLPLPPSPPPSAVAIPTRRPKHRSTRIRSLRSLSRETALNRPHRNPHRVIKQREKVRAALLFHTRSPQPAARSPQPAPSSHTRAPQPHPHPHYPSPTYTFSTASKMVNGGLVKMGSVRGSFKRAVSRNTLIKMQVLVGCMVRVGLVEKGAEVKVVWKSCALHHIQSTDSPAIPPPEFDGGRHAK